MCICVYIYMYMYIYIYMCICIYTHTHSTPDNHVYCHNLPIYGYQIFLLSNIISITISPKIQYWSGPNLSLGENRRAKNEQIYHISCVIQPTRSDCQLLTPILQDCVNEFCCATFSSDWTPIHNQQDDIQYYKLNSQKETGV